VGLEPSRIDRNPVLALAQMDDAVSLTSAFRGR